MRGPPMLRAARGSAFAALMVVLLLLGGCRASSAPLTAVVRLVDDPGVARPTELLDWDIDVTLAGESRPVISAARAVSVLARW